MRTLLIVLLAVAQIVLVAHGDIPFSGSNRVQSTLVSFPSSPASGKLLMHGTLFSPKQSKTKSVAVFMHGSGASNRYEEVHATFWNTDAKPEALKPQCGVNGFNMMFFGELAEIFLDNGISVLVYDKRGCCSAQYSDYCSQCQIDPLGHFTDTCYYACSPTDPPQKLNVNALSVYDEIEDAANAMSYLQKEHNFENLIVVGHSQGVNLAPAAVNKYFNITSGKALNLTHVLLLAGGVTEFDDLLLDQYQRIINRANELETACVNDPSAPSSKEIIASMKKIEEGYQSLIPIAKDFFEKFKQGVYPLDHVYRLDFALTGTYLMSCINTSTLHFFDRQITSPFLERIKLLTMNSPTDPNIHERDYSPLLDYLKKRSPARTNVNVVPYLTHFLTNSSLVSPQPKITSHVKDILSQFLSN